MHRLRVYLQIKSDIINLLLALYMFWHLVDLIAGLRSILKPLNALISFVILIFDTRLNLLFWTESMKYMFNLFMNARVKYILSVPTVNRIWIHRYFFNENMAHTIKYRVSVFWKYHIIQCSSFMSLSLYGFS